MERCPSCNSPVNVDSNFCNECGYNLIEAAGATMNASYSKKKYKLRSPMLESELLYDRATEKKYGITVIVSYGFWLCSLIFLVFGVKIVYDSYTVDLFTGLISAFLYFALAFLCFILPGAIHILVDIEDHLALLAREAKKDKID